MRTRRIERVANDAKQDTVAWAAGRPGLRRGDEKPGSTVGQVSVLRATGRELQDGPPPVVFIRLRLNTEIDNKQ